MNERNSCVDVVRWDVQPRQRDGGLSASVLWNPFTDPPPEMRGAFVAVGNFDGVHRGHCRLLAVLRDRARRANAAAVALSFQPHPLAVLEPAAAPVPLTWPERKQQLLLAAGADGVLLCEVTPQFLDLSADDFLQQILIEKLNVRGIVEGPNFGFGKDRAGDIDLLRQFCQQQGISMDVVPLAGGDPPISSSLVRRFLASGEVEKASECLGRPHRILGIVVAGDQRGRSLGFPTANLDQTLGMIPAEGVYAVHVAVDDSVFAGACNVGPNPTFSKQEHKVEVHLIDYDGDLYGRSIEVDFLQRLRPTMRFENAQALEKQMHVDVQNAREVSQAHQADLNAKSGLSETIFQWLQMHAGEAIEQSGGQLESARLDEAGTLEVDWRLPEGGANLPADTFSLLFRLEEQLRIVFPEVHSVRSRSPRPVSRSE